MRFSVAPLRRGILLLPLLLLAGSAGLSGSAFASAAVIGSAGPVPRPGAHGPLFVPAWPGTRPGGWAWDGSPWGGRPWRGGLWDMSAGRRLPAPVSVPVRGYAPLSVVRLPVPVPALAGAELRLEVAGRPPGPGNPGPAPAPSRAVLTCFPPDGSHPYPEAACEVLQRVGGDPGRLRPRGGRMCAMIYDPVVLSASGRWLGHRIDYRREFPNRCLALRATGPVFAFGTATGAHAA